MKPSLHALALTPPLRLDAQRGALSLTSGREDFRQELLGRMPYWPSQTAGEGLFCRVPTGKEREDEIPLRVLLDRVLLYPEGNPFDEEQQRALALAELWRVLPDLPTNADYTAALVERPYRRLGPELKPAWDEVFDAMVEDLAESLRSQGVFRFVPGFLRRSQARSRLSLRWPEYRDAREKEFAAIEAAISAGTPGEAAWPTYESQRIAVLRRLIEGDVELIEREALRFLTSALTPFESQMHFLVRDARSACLSFSAPSLDRIITSATRDLLPGGEVRKVKRDKEELHRDFTVLVSGQALHFAAHLFAKLPTLERLSVAASTFGTSVSGKRGRARAESQDAAAYTIFEVELRRRDFEDPFLAPFDAMVFLSEHHARISPISSVALGRIDPPDWLP